MNCDSCATFDAIEEVEVPALVEVASSQGAVLFEGEATPGQLQEMAIGDKASDLVVKTGTAVAKVAGVITACTTDLLAAFDELSTEKRDGGAFKSAVIELGVTVTAEGN